MLIFVVVRENALFVTIAFSTNNASDSFRLPAAAAEISRRDSIPGISYGKTITGATGKDLGGYP